MKMKDSKFNGNIKQDIKGAIKMYQICSLQKRDFFTHAFEGTTRRFFMEKTSPGMNFPMMCKKMEQNTIAKSASYRLRPV